MSEYTDSPELNSYSDTGWYVPADTISDSDVENVAAGPLAIFMLVLFVTVASSVLNSADLGKKHPAASKCVLPSVDRR